MSIVNEDLIPVQVMLTPDVNEKIESIMKQLGLRSKGAVIERLLVEVLGEDNN